MCFLFLFLAAAAELFQVRAATIKGTVTDPGGRAVRVAEVQLRHLEDGKRYDANSDTKGSYEFDGLPGGTYELMVPEIGFSYARYERKDISLQDTETLRLDLRLEWSGGLGTVGDDDSTILRANRRPAPAGPAPRMADGKPDLSGVWNGRNESNPEHPSALPWAEALANARIKSNGPDNPSVLCLPADVLLISPNPFQIIQTPSVLLILAEYNNGPFREVFLDGRGHPQDPNPTWMGHSTGKWEGDTLVVDTVGFNDMSWLDVYPHTEKLHVTTRYRRPDTGHLDIEILIEDPGTFTEPWKMHVVWDLTPGEEIQEFICNENNKDLQHLPAK